MCRTAGFLRETPTEMQPLLRPRRRGSSERPAIVREIVGGKGYKTSLLEEAKWMVKGSSTSFEETRNGLQEKRKRTIVCIDTREENPLLKRGGPPLPERFYLTQKWDSRKGGSLERNCRTGGTELNARFWGGKKDDR